MVIWYNKCIGSKAVNVYDQFKNREGQSDELIGKVEYAPEEKKGYNQYDVDQDDMIREHGMISKKPYKEGILTEEAKETLSKDMDHVSLDFIIENHRFIKADI